MLEAAWKVQKMASSWNQAQGALARVPQVSRRRENCQTREGPGQREREAAPGSQLRDEPGGKDGRCRAEEKQGELARKGSRALQLEPILQHREAALRQQQAGARERQDSKASRDRKVQGGFPDPSLLAENLQRKADRDGSRRERRRRQGKTHSWQQELGKERRLLAEREKPRLEPCRTVRPREGNRTSSMAGIRSCTPLPQGA